MTPPKIVRPGLRPRNIFLTILGLSVLMVFVVFAIVVIGVLSYIHLGGDSRALRNSLTRSVAVPWHKKFEANVGAFTVGMARMGLNFAHLDPKARLALQAVTSGEVGVYDLADNGGEANRASLLSAADKVMDGRGWDRLVGVVQPGTLVAIYVLRTAPSTGDLSICFAVVEQEHMVIGEARGNLAPLVELVMSQKEWHPERLSQIRF